MNKWLIVTLVLVALGVTGGVAYKEGKESGRSAVQGKWDAANAVAANTRRDNEHKMQDKVDEAAKQGGLALATVEDDAASARDAGERLRAELVRAEHRARVQGAELTGERKAAAERERVYAKLLAESTRAIEEYARAADRSYERGMICERAWPVAGK